MSLASHTLSQELLQSFSLHDPEHSQSIKNAIHTSETDYYRQLTRVYEGLKEEFMLHDESEVKVTTDSANNEPNTQKNFGSVEHVNGLIMDLIQEQHDILKFLQIRFEKWVPLSEYLKTSVDYATVTLKLLNMASLSNINNEDFDQILPSSVLMLIKMNISTLKQKTKPFDEQESDMIRRAAQDILRIEQLKKEMLQFLESKMRDLAPNISELVGTEIAAHLIGTAGSLDNFARLTADNIQSLGRERKSLLGLSSKTQVQSFSGFIGKMEMINMVHPKLRKRVEKMIANKLKLVANIDLLGKVRDGSEGRRYLQEIHKAIENMEKPAPNRQEKPLPAPILKSKKRRGGSKSRHLKELQTMTAMQKLKSRIKFGVAPVVDEYTGEEYGMLGVDGGDGPLKIPTKTKSNKTSNQNNKPGNATGTTTVQPFYGGMLTRPGSGLASSLAFTSTQSMQLPNPKLLEQKQEKESTRSYFSHFRGFSCKSELEKAGSNDGAHTAPAAAVKKEDFQVPNMPARKRRKLDNE